MKHFLLCTSDHSIHALTYDKITHHDRLMDALGKMSVFEKSTDEVGRTRFNRLNMSTKGDKTDKKVLNRTSRQSQSDGSIIKSPDKATAKQKSCTKDEKVS